MSRPFYAAVAALFFLACDPPTDIGHACALQNPDGGPGGWNVTSSTSDYYNNSTAECQNLVCLRPAGSPLDAGLGICSSPCTPQNASDANSSSEDCNGSSIPIVCRQVALDPAFIAQVKNADGGADLLKKYLGGTTPPVFCTTPVDAGG